VIRNYLITVLKLHGLGYDVGSRLLDLYVYREKNSKRETKLINMLLFIKSTLWKVRNPKLYVHLLIRSLI
jgi:hypothetical protein